MKSLFVRSNGKNHCLCVRRVLKDGLCVFLNGVAVNVMSCSPDVVTTGKVSVMQRINGENQCLLYRYPGYFTYDYREGFNTQKYVNVYIENGVYTIVEGADKFYEFDEFSGLFVRMSKEYMHYSFDGYSKVDSVYMITSTVYNAFRNYLDPVYEITDVAIHEYVSDGEGGFYLAITAYGSRTDSELVDEDVRGLIKFHIDDINSAPTFVDTYGIYPYGTQVPYILTAPEGIRDTVNGYDIVYDTLESQWYLEKVNGSTSERIAIPTGNIIFDPVVQKYFILLKEVGTPIGTSASRAFNLYSASTPTSWTLVTTLGTYTTAKAGSIATCRQSEFL